MLEVNPLLYSPDPLRADLDYIWSPGHYIVRIRSEPLWTIYNLLLYMVRIRSKPLWTIYKQPLYIVRNRSKPIWAICTPELAENQS